MNILLTNDDGIKAPGIQALLECMPDSVTAVGVAPANEKSASSHSISLGQKLRVENVSQNGVIRYAVHGTPADCVKFALYELKTFVPDLIISGINQGANTGVSVYYSGTISAAREGLINRVPSIAISLCSTPFFRDFSAAQAILRRIVEAYQSHAFPERVMLNVNVPPLPESEIQGVKITKQADSHFIEEFVTEEQHDGKKIYTLAGEIELMDPDGTSDEEAVMKGFISITPLKLDVTDYGSMPFFKRWIENGAKKNS